MLWVVVVCAQCNRFKCIAESGIKALTGCCFYAGRQLGILYCKLFLVGCNRFCGKDLFVRNDCHRVFCLKNVIVLLRSVLVNRFFEYARGNVENEERAFLKCCLDRIVEVFARDEIFVVPYSDIACEIVSVYKIHQFHCLFSVLLSVGKKNIRIKCTADLLGKLITDNYGRKIFCELFAVWNRGFIIDVTFKILNASQPH